MKTKKLFLLPALSISLFACANVDGSKTSDENTNQKEEDKTPSDSEEDKKTEEEKEDKEDSTEQENEDPIEDQNEVKPLDYSKNKSPLKETYIAKQYYLNNIGDIYSVWDSYRGDGVTIAVIDVGFKYDHEDYTFENGESKVLDSSAYIKTEYGKTSIINGKENVFIDEESHGTFCAGVAAAGLNGKGIVGIAPNANLMLIKTDLKPTSIAEAFSYAAKNGAKVITISNGSYENYYKSELVNDGTKLETVFNKAINDECISKNVVVCAAGGNGGEIGNRTLKCYPAAVEGIIGVGGLMANSTADVWDGSTTAATCTDLFAPSNLMFGCCHYSGKKYDGGWNGTSFASPIVAGAAALYFQKYPKNTYSQFKTDLINSCMSFKSSYTGSRELKRLDIGALMGISTTGTIRVKASYSKDTPVYYYFYNKQLDKELVPWPGVLSSTGIGDVHYYDVDSSKYDYVVMSFKLNNTEYKTPNLLISSFKSGRAYKITTLNTEKDYHVGSYVLV